MFTYYDSNGNAQENLAKNSPDYIRLKDHFEQGKVAVGHSCKSSGIFPTVKRCSKKAKSRDMSSEVIQVLHVWLQNQSAGFAFSFDLYTKLRLVSKPKQPWEKYEELSRQIKMVDITEAPRIYALYRLVLRELPFTTFWLEQREAMLNCLGDDISGLQWSGGQSLCFRLVNRAPVPNGPREKYYEFKSPFELAAPYSFRWFGWYVNIEGVVPANLKIKWLLSSKAHNRDLVSWFSLYLLNLQRVCAEINEKVRLFD